MLTISTIPEALAELEKSTRRVWTESELFDLAVNCGIELHAAPPITARTTIQKFIVGEGLVEKFRSPPGHALLAVLFPWQVAQLWMSGETKTSHPSKHDEMEGEYQLFTEPVRITREQVRIKAATLQKMFAVWSQAQAGRWIEDTTKPGDMRYQNCPEWMFPAEEFVPVQTAATPVVASGKKWNDEKLTELKTYREAHTMPETAAKFGISEQRIRELLPSEKAKAKPFAGLTHRMK